MRLETHVGKEFSGAFMIMMFLLLTFTFVLPSPMATFPRVLEHSYSPTTIAAASIPVKPTEPIMDWINTLNWMRVNLKSTDVVASWWDYGYWITTLANKTTIVDNATLNSTQIKQVGRMFMSNETEAIKILDKFDATYVVVFTTFTGEGQDGRWGDEGKWRWMARIGGLDENDYGSLNETTNEWDWNSKGKETVIYKLMQHGEERTLGVPSTVQLEHFVEAHLSQTPGYPRQYGPAVPLVCVYKINYD